MADVTPAVITGAFALGGVLLTALSVLVSNLLNRSHTRADAKAALAYKRAEELRTERMKIYPQVLSLGSKWSNRATMVDLAVKEGRLLKVTAENVSPVLEADLSLMEEVDHCITAASLIAGQEVLRLLNEYEDALNNYYVYARMGLEASPTLSSRQSLLQAMREETDLIRMT